MEPFKITGRLGWYVRYSDPNRPPGKQWVTAKGGKTIGEAFVTKARLEEEASLIHRGVVTRHQLRVADATKRPILELLDEWKKSMDDEERSAPHVARYYAYAKAIINDQLPPPITCGKKHAQADRPGPRRITALSEIDSAVVGTFLGKLIKPPLNRSYSTRNEYLTAIKCFWLWAMGVKGQRKRVATPLDALSKLRAAKDPRRGRRALCSEDFERFIAAVREKADLWKRGANTRHVQRRGRGASWYAAFYLVGGRAGGRWTEIARLRWEHVLFDNAEINFGAEITKTGEAGTVPMLPDVATALMEIRQTEWTPGAEIFGAMPSRRTFIRHLKLAGIDYLDAGKRVSLRKSLASQLIAIGTVPRALQMIMRHRDIRTTFQHYSDPALVDAQGALAALKTSPGRSRSRTAV